ncbi:MAG: NFACT RNA binding domain-containing protein [Candidatus Micrarchaeota archaeon]
MDIEFNLKKTARKNLTEVYDRLRTLKEKRKGMIGAIKQTESEIEREQKAEEGKAKLEIEIKGKGGREEEKGILGKAKMKGEGKGKKKKKHWWNAFHAFLSSAGKYAVAGKNAKQNDELYSRHFFENDLFFHADIQGAPAVILKNGKDANEEELKEAAQWAASYSSAWKIGAAGVDVYAVEEGQVSKHAQGGYIGRGAFAIEGERKWFKKTELKLKIGIFENEIIVLPAIHPIKLSKQILLSPGGVEKEEAAKQLSSYLSAKADEIASMLPSGKFAIKI